MHIYATIFFFACAVFGVTACFINERRYPERAYVTVGIAYGGFCAGLLCLLLGV